MDQDSEEILQKARVCYRLGATHEDISNYLDVSEEVISYYLEEEVSLSEEDQIDYNLESFLGSSYVKYSEERLDQKVSKTAVELVESIYDNWQSLDEASKDTGNIHVSVYKSKNIVDRREKHINNVLKEEELRDSKNYDTVTASIGKDYNDPRDLFDPDEESLETLLTSQRYADPVTSKRGRTNASALEWFIKERNGTASESEIKQFIQFFLNKNHPHLERKIYDIAQISDNISQRGIVREKGKRSEKGDRLYQVSTEPEIDEELEDFLENTLQMLETGMEEQKRIRYRYPRRIASRQNIDKIVDVEE